MLKGNCELRLLMLLILLFALCSSFRAQEEEQSQGDIAERKFYYDYKDKPKNQTGKPKPNVAGKPGAEVSIELNRNGKTFKAAPDTVFYSGEHFRIHVKLNFTGYIAIINKGPSGAEKLLYPYDGKTKSLPPSKSFSVPLGTWYNFDETKGIETVIVIISRKPIPVIEKFWNEGKVVKKDGEPTVATTQKQKTERHDENMSSDDSEDSRDIGIVSNKNKTAGYALAEEADLSKQLRIVLRLVHQ